MKKAIIATLASLAVYTVGTAFADTDIPVRLYGAVNYRSGSPVAAGDSLVVFDEQSGSPIDTLIVGFNPDGSPIPDGNYHAHLDSDFDGLEVRLRHLKEGTLRNVYLDIPGEPVVFNLDREDNSVKNLLVNNDVSGVRDEFPDISSITNFRPAPNPMNPKTNFMFDLKEEGTVEIKLYDIRGRLVKDFGNESYSQGAHSIPWDGRDDRGTNVASGQYQAVIRTKEDVETTSVTVIK